VRRWRRETEFAARMERLDLQEVASKLTKTQQNELAKVAHDQPLTEALRFAVDCKPQKDDFKELIGKVTEATSDEEALAAIAQAREDARPIGPPPHRAYRNPAARQARMHLGGLLKINPADVYDPNSVEADEAKWREAKAIIDQALAVYAEHRPLQPA
jgi:hypothetical protein